MTLIPRRTICDEAGVLFYRWRLARFGRCELYLHHYMKSDSARGLHDHPWKWALALPLYPGYTEYRAKRPAAFPSIPLEGLPLEDLVVAGPRNRLQNESLVVNIRRRAAPSIYYLGRQDFHRIRLDKGPSWSLFLAGPRIKRWGFLWQDETGLHYDLSPDNSSRWEKARGT